MLFLSAKKSCFLFTIVICLNFQNNSCPQSPVIESIKNEVSLFSEETDNLACYLMFDLYLSNFRTKIYKFSQSLTKLHKNKSIALAKVMKMHGIIYSTSAPQVTIIKNIEIILEKILDPHSELFTKRNEFHESFLTDNFLALKVALLFLAKHLFNKHFEADSVITDQELLASTLTLDKLVLIITPELDNFIEATDDLSFCTIS